VVEPVETTGIDLDKLDQPVRLDQPVELDQPVFRCR
jgi:hypothetical protein